MKGRIQEVSCHERQLLAAGWEMAGLPAGAASDPEALARVGGAWVGAPVPGTVGSALRLASDSPGESPRRRLDADDWWYRTDFTLDAPSRNESVVLGFDGLATLAEVWLDGRPILRSDNMFVSHEVPVDGIEAGSHTLAIRFASIDAHLKPRRPRPRWRTPMVENQQLRWVRTTLLGRTPGWSPPYPATGPWGAVWIERRRTITVDAVRLAVSVEEANGTVSVECQLQALDAEPVGAVRLVISRAGRRWVGELHNRPGAPGYFSGRAIVDDVARWWPHTHGEPACYEAQLEVQAGASSRAPIKVSLGPIGFRDVAVRTASGDFAVAVNGVDVFCRGACWTPLDCVSLSSSRDAYVRALQQVRDAGMNMVRVGGTMVYESNDFLSLCDSFGIMVWHDLMFANMDYPADDADFSASVAREVPAQLARLQGHPCVTVICGNSEAGQQAAMWGAPRELWNPPFFAERLRDYAAATLPDVPYVPSSTYGGDFPHQASAGPASYYGVGAYLRPLEDARRSDVRFASECLAFANVPEPESILKLAGEQSIKVHFPRWKERVPRDLGAGWDFDDVRDHYLQDVFGIDPLALRYAEHERYLELGRVASGFVMQRTFAEWRRPGSVTRGALIWFLRDLWLGAGWGLIDSDGTPKAAFWFVKRSLRPQAVLLSDEGVNGLAVHIVNERPAPLTAQLEFAAFRGLEARVEHAVRGVQVPAHGSVRLSATELLGGFRDLTYAYRFGAPIADVVVARLLGTDGEVVGEDAYFPGRAPPVDRGEVGLAASATRHGPREAVVTVSARRYAFCVRIDAPTWSAADQLFSVAPGMPVSVKLSAADAGRPTGTKLRLTAVNGLAPVTAAIPD